MAMSFDRSEVARMLASLPRRKIERTCVVCGKTMQGNAKRQYCSDTCSKRAFRKRQRTKVIA